MIDLGIIDKYREEMIETLASLVLIPSVAKEPLRTRDGVVMPCGRQVHECLVKFLELGESFGLSSFNASNYGGHLEWTPDSDADSEVFGIVGHLDVVPAGDGWNTDAFILRKDGDKLLGRGTSDDKGPMIAALFAIKALKELGLRPRRTIRLIAGIDEEIGMDSIDKYLELAGKPDLGFTPDAEFPLVIGEKGIHVVELAQKVKTSSNAEGLTLSKLVGGTAHNAVPDTCKAVIHPSSQEYENLLKTKISSFNEQSENQITYRKQGSSISIEAKGRSAHAQSPDTGLSAISVMMEFLGNIELNCEDINDFINFYNKRIAYEYQGESLGIKMSDEESGELTVNAGLINYSKGFISLTLDIRYPVTASQETVRRILNQTIDGTSIGSHEVLTEESIYMDPETSHLCQELMAAYSNQTGDTDCEPIVMGGGTYAKKVPGILAFGAAMPSDPDTMHQANEYITIDRLILAAKIYAEAIYRLCIVGDSDE